MAKYLPRKVDPAVLAWAGLAGYVFVVDIALLLKGNKPMTEVWREALRHPAHRWVVIAAWGFTTKHLFAGNFIPWLDPFNIIAAGAMAIQKLTGAEDAD